MAKRVPEGFHETVEELNLAGLTVPQIAHETGVTTPTVRASLVKQGLLANRRVRKVDAVDDEKFKRAYYDEKWPIHQIKDEFGLHSTEIYQLIRNRGWTPRTETDEAKNDRKDALDHAMQLYVNNLELTIMQICNETGISQPLLHAEVRKRDDVEFRRPSKARTERWYD